jgi:hypothetical protein
MQPVPFFTAGFLFGIIGLVHGWLPALSRAAEPPRGEVDFFETKIRPVLVDQCYECHATGAAKVKGGLLLDTREGLLRGGESGPALVPGKPGESLLVAALKHENLEMPPKKKLSGEVVGDFVRWIESGAVDPRSAAGGASSASAPKGVDFEKGRRHWAFIPPARGPRPVVKRDEWPRGEVDYHVLAALESRQLRPVAPAGKRELLRRATFDLTGLPPTPAEIAGFLADSSPGAFGRVVERLLASPHYGERWGRYWLDVARYAEDQAHTFGVTPNTSGYRYRDWVIEAFNADMPYNEFVMRQIAGDRLGEAPEVARKHLPALGFFGLGAQYYKNSDKAKVLADELDDRVDTLTRGFLGLTVACARCHDHKFDPVPTQDYYSLAGVFQSCNMVNIPLVAREEVALYDAGQARVKAVDSRLKAFGTGQKKTLAENEVGRIPEYLQALWKSRHPKNPAAGADLKAQMDAAGLREGALKKWAELLEPSKKGQLPAMAPWFELEAAAASLSEDEVFTRLGAAGELIQKRVYAALAERDGRPVSETAPARGEAKFVSPVLNPQRRVARIDLDVTGARHLYLVVTDGGDGINSDHADWCEPRLVGPAGERKLTDLPWTSARASYGTVRLHANFAGAALSLEGRRFEDGIGTHAASEVVYEIPEGYQRFTATVGLDGAAVGSVQFRVYFAPPGDNPTGGLKEAKLSPQAQDLLTAVVGDKGVLSVGDQEWEKLLPEGEKAALQALKAELEETKKGAPPIYALAHGIADATARDMKVFMRGDPARTGEVAPRRFLRILSREGEPERFVDGSGRRELAEAVASPSNPLTARVMVNRIWQHHFGVGLVGTPSNFGTLGEAPTHPALLDYLAVRFVESGWSIKAMHRELMLSATYQLAAVGDADNERVDAENRWLWRMNRRRLDVESWRDAMLSVSGLLDTQRGGPSTDLAQANNRRRTVYGKVSRHELDGVLRLFDFPDANITSDKRTETTVPQQQLFVLNSPFVVEQAKALSARLLADRALADDAARLDHAFLLAYGRPVAPEELTVLAAYLRESDPEGSQNINKLSRWERVAQTLLGANEFLYTD